MRMKLYIKNQFKQLSKIKQIKIKRIRSKFLTNLMLKDKIEEKINLKFFAKVKKIRIKFARKENLRRIKL